MTRLALAFSDFAQPLDAGGAPRLPALARLLSRGRLQAASTASWRHWVLASAGLSAPRQLPAAAILAGGAGTFAVATPLNLLAGLGHVHIDPRGPLELRAAEWGELCAGFNREFGDAGFSLAACGRLGLLSLPRALDAVTHDPEPLAGREAGDWLPSGPDGGWLRRVMTEAQMWLYRHPLNEAREARGEVPVNALWFWGLGPDAPRWAGAPPPALATDDPVLRRLWRRAGGPVSSSPASLAAWLGTPEPAGIVTLSLAAWCGEAGAALEAAEHSWFVPLAEALAGGRVASAELYLGGRVAILGRADRLRFWRSTQAWHEALQ